MPFTRDRHEGAERLGDPQRRDVGGYLRLETRADQAGAGLGRGKLVGVFDIVEKRQMHRAGFVERREAPDDLAAPGGIDQYRLRQRGDVSQRRRRRLLVKYRLRHSTRRSPPSCHSRRPVLIHQNRRLAF